MQKGELVMLDMYFLCVCMKLDNLSIEHLGLTMAGDLVSR